MKEVKQGNGEILRVVAGTTAIRVVREGCSGRGQCELRCDGTKKLTSLGCLGGSLG